MEQQSTNILKQSILFIHQHSLADTPINYTVCYEFFLGKQPLLNKKINDALNNNNEISNQIMQYWFDTLLTDYDLKDLNQTQTGLNKIATELALTTTEVEDSISQFNHSLTTCKNELRSTKTNSSLASIAFQLINSSSSMQAEMEQIKQQFLNCKQEIASLQKRLEMANIDALSSSLTELTQHKTLPETAKKKTSSTMNHSNTGSSTCLLMLDMDHLWE